MDPEPLIPGGSRTAGSRNPYAEFSEDHRRSIEAFWESVAPTREGWIRRRRYYYQDIADAVRNVVPEGSRVLHVGSGTGWLLAAVKPSRGVGVEVSAKLIDMCRAKYPELHWVHDRYETFRIDETFDYVIVMHALGFCFDLGEVFANIRRGCDRQTRLILIHHNFLWEPVFRLAESLGLRMRQPMQNFLRIGDVVNELNLTGFDVVKTRYRMLLPVWIPLVSWLANRLIVHFWGINQLAFTEVIVARPSSRSQDRRAYSYSVVAPCRNEEGHIEDLVRRTPRMGRETELILVDDRSTDGTRQEMLRCMGFRQDIRVRWIEGPGINKAEAVRRGFQVAEGDVLMILDADLAVAPEELPRFSEAIESGSGDFINGVRFVYPQQHGAMRFLNVLGNRFFAWIVSVICDQPVSDALCGTKVFFRRDYWRFESFKDTWGVRDRWGDFEQLFGASKIGLRIVNLPVHYMRREYGETKMKKRFHNGWHMLRLCWTGFLRMRWS